MQNLYSDYFGLKEASFSITPDLQYLFFSEQHREALAHLFYRAGTSSGFVLLTGEVGTGKTTVCQAFIEQLPDTVEVAFILNPATTVTELLPPSVTSCASRCRSRNAPSNAWSIASMTIY